MVTWGRFHLAGLLVVAMFLAAASWAGGRSGAAAPVTTAVLQPPLAELSIPNTRRIDFTSQVNGHRYSIRMALPFVSPPPQGYGVLYVLDGNWYIGSATEAVRTWNAPSVVVVAIGYPDDAAYVQSVIHQCGPVPDSLKNLPPTQIAPSLERSYDLTLPGPIRNWQPSRIRARRR